MYVFQFRPNVYDALQTCYQNYTHDAKFPPFDTTTHFRSGCISENTFLGKNDPTLYMLLTFYKHRKYYFFVHFPLKWNLEATSVKFKIADAS